MSLLALHASSSKCLRVLKIEKPYVHFVEKNSGSIYLYPATAIFVDSNVYYNERNS